MDERDYDEEAYWAEAYIRVDSVGDEYYDDGSQRCEHGVYVGGCGADYMCGYCEMGVTMEELREQRRADKIFKARRRREAAARLFLAMVQEGMNFYEIKERMEFYGFLPA